MLIYIVSHGSYNDDGEFDCYGVDKAFYNEADAKSFKEKKEILGEKTTRLMNWRLNNAM